MLTGCIFPELVGLDQTSTSMSFTVDLLNSASGPYGDHGAQRREEQQEQTPLFCGDINLNTIMSVTYVARDARAMPRSLAASTRDVQRKFSYLHLAGCTNVRCVAFSR